MKVKAIFHYQYVKKTKQLCMIMKHMHDSYGVDGGPSAVHKMLIDVDG